MTVTKVWELLPDSDLSERANWRSLGGDRYSALRVRILIVQSNGSSSLLGPALESLTVAPHDTVELHQRSERVITRTNTISQAVKFAATSRVYEGLSSKVSAELSAKAPGYSGKLSTYLLTKSEYEITALTEETLGSVASYIIQETLEDEHVIKLEGSEVKRTAELRRRYWPRRWDIYLHSFDYLELSYQRPWFWSKTRRTIKSANSVVVGWPLGSITYYEPQASRDVSYGLVPDELVSPDIIEVRPLDALMPRSIAPQEQNLEDLAKFAFPATSQESRASRARASQAKAARKAKKPLPVEDSASKKYGRNVGAKKTARKAAAKKAVRKTAAKKTAKKTAR